MSTTNSTSMRIVESIGNIIMAIIGLATFISAGGYFLNPSPGTLASTLMAGTLLLIALGVSRVYARFK